jgi:hypothetical protein
LWQLVCYKANPSHDRWSPALPRNFPAGTC